MEITALEDALFDIRDILMKMTQIHSDILEQLKQQNKNQREQKAREIAVNRERAF